MYEKVEIVHGTLSLQNYLPGPLYNFSLASYKVIWPGKGVITPQLQHDGGTSIFVHNQLALRSALNNPENTII